MWTIILAICIALIYKISVEISVEFIRYIRTDKPVLSEATQTLLANVQERSSLWYPKRALEVDIKELPELTDGIDPNAIPPFSIATRNGAVYHFSRPLTDSERNRYFALKQDPRYQHLCPATLKYMSICIERREKLDELDTVYEDVTAGSLSPAAAGNLIDGFFEMTWTQPKNFKTDIFGDAFQAATMKASEAERVQLYRQEIAKDPDYTEETQFYKEYPNFKYNTATPTQKARRMAAFEITLNRRYYKSAYLSIQSAASKAYFNK